ncbi:DUF2382 domain-containing protein [Leptolyngbya sp. FACHB-261]|uniref:DUF2382 domain-containing protein n=1 Tax=Leptolyngbya sp. FACHB-261 TaxID=2692806 RepID=UPI00168955DD|nr:DUF2382 domain-containing protein [Leptolyngbya sp. FACHB-261]MBD2101947.1 DUF2382 domain-containing protein [Leptolyngbya sp. FACHB-261]
MALLKLKDFDPNYREFFGGGDIKGLDVYSDDTQEKVGKVNDVLVDENGRFRYLVVDVGFWFFGKKVLVPVGRSRIAIDHDARRVYVMGLSKKQAEDLPEFDEHQGINDDYEERVRGVYRTTPATPATERMISPVVPMDASPVPMMDSSAFHENPLRETTLHSTSVQDNFIQPSPIQSAPIPSEPIQLTPVQAYSTSPRSLYQERQDGIAIPPQTLPQSAPTTPQVDTLSRGETYDYHSDPGLYNLNSPDHEVLRLYEERLIANRKRQKAGEVAIGKHVETETARVSVPVEKEHVIIERSTPTNNTVFEATDNDFVDGEVARIEVYEETARIRREPFVREEVRLKKEVYQDTVEAEETLRREKLDIDTQGHPTVDRRIETQGNSVVEQRMDRKVSRFPEDWTK